MTLLGYIEPSQSNQPPPHLSNKNNQCYTTNDTAMNPTLPGIKDQIIIGKQSSDEELANALAADRRPTCRPPK
jgi:hypothetical protein